MSLKHPFASRSVVEKADYRFQLSLPAADLASHDVDRGDVLPIQWEPATATLEIILDAHHSRAAVDDHYPGALALPIVPVGAALGVTIPSEVRRYHGLDVSDDLLLQGRDGDRWEINLDDEQRATVTAVSD